jgi:hypothetical protein
MRKKLAIFSVIGATLAALAVGSIGVLSASAQGGQEDNVFICHRTDAANNPYSTITVDVSSIDGISGNEPGGQGDHFLEHTGPLASTEEVAQALKDAGIEWGDIIPPVEGVHGGLNFTAEGQAILENDCNFVTPPTPPTTEAPPVTTAAPPGPAAPAARPPAAVAAVPTVTG